MGIKAALKATFKWPWVPRPPKGHFPCSLLGARSAQRAATAAAAAGRVRLAAQAADRDFEEVEPNDHDGLEEQQACTAAAN